MRRSHLCAAAFFLTLAGCVGAGEIIENAAYAGTQTTLKYALWGGGNEVTYSRQICEAFVRKHPEIRLEVSVYPWGQYWAKLQTQAAAGVAPDVISLYSGNAALWIARGALLPLDEFVRRSELDLGDYHRSAIDICSWEGKLYCMPLEIPVRTLVFSKTRLEEVGIPKEAWPRPDTPLSWDEFQALCRKLLLRRPDGAIEEYAMTSGVQWNNVMFRMCGGDFTDRQVNPARPTVLGNEPLVRGIVDVFVSQYAERWTLGAMPLSAGAVNNLDTILLSRKFALGTTGPWGLAAMQKAGVRFGLAPMPRGARPSQLIGANSAGIYARSSRATEAWMFISFMASPEIQPLFGRMLKGVPALKAAAPALIHNEFGIEGCEAFLHDLPVSAPELSCANSYVPAALNKWLSDTELALDNKYETGRRNLPRPGGILSDADEATFTAGMRAFVEQTVRARLPLLHAELTDAFARARPAAPTWLVRVALPALALALLVVSFAAYLGWIFRRREPEAAPRRRTPVAGYLFLSPWLIGCVCFTAVPIAAAVAFSFTDWNMIAPPLWVGFQNYVSLLGDARFITGLQRTLLYAALVIPISLCGGLFTAGLLTCDIRGRDAFKAIFYFPSLFTGAAAAVIWVNMFNKEFGVVNRILGFVGIAPVNWLDTAHAFGTVILMNVFWLGGAMIIYYAGMKQIPRSLYEAAEVDGAGPARKFFHITIPMLSPVIFFMVVMTTIGAFQVFTPALFLASDSTMIGAPGDALRFYSVNIYDEAFNNLRMGRACCYAVILFLLIFAVTLVQLRLSKRFVHTGGT